MTSSTVTRGVSSAVDGGGLSQSGISWTPDSHNATPDAVSITTGNNGGIKPYSRWNDGIVR